jgi:glutamyl-tRNA reductase
MKSVAAGIDRFGVVGFNHRQLPARLRGLLAFDDAWAHRLSEQLRGAKLAEGVAFISTCNRQEIVISADHPAFTLELVRSQMHARLVDAAHGGLPEPYRHLGEDAVRHMLRVSASLDSLVVGEREITQQLRRSFDRSREAGWMDKTLNGLARIAVENAKEIHQRTALGAESVGVFTLARDLVLKETEGLAKPRVAVVGLGEIGLRTARAFAVDHRVSLTISSRRARTADEVGSTLSACPYVTLDRLPNLLQEMDAIVLATGAGAPVVTAELLEAARARVDRPLVLIDIGIPPQADDVDGVAQTRLFNLDWFAKTGFGQRPHAREALKHALQIVEEGVQRVAEWTNIRRYSGLFDSCVTLTEDFKARIIPDVVKAELQGLPPEQQKLVHTSMHRLLTAYSESIFEALNRELSERSEKHVEPEQPDHRQSRQ